MMRRNAGRAVAISLVGRGAPRLRLGAADRARHGGRPAAAPLTMTWRSGLFGESGKMSAVMPDGERFSGTYQVVSPGMSRSVPRSGLDGGRAGQNQGQIDDSMWGAGRDTLPSPDVREQGRRHPQG